MEIAIGTGFFTKRDVDVNSGHNDDKDREYNFLKIYLSKDYSDPGTRIAEIRPIPICGSHNYPSS